MAHPYDPETVVLGVVGRPHGVRGEVSLRAHNAHGRSFEGLREILLVRAGVVTPHTIVGLRLTPDGALAKLAGVDTREAAAALTLSEVRARRAALPPLGPGEFYVDDVLGCAVVHDSGRVLGVVTSTFWNGAQDVMVIRPPHVEVEVDVDVDATGTADAEVAAAAVAAAEAAAEVLIPLIPEFVVKMDAPGRRIVVSWEGHD